MSVPSDLNAAKAEMMGGHLSSAIEICNRILSLQPGDQQALELRAEAFLLTQDYESARADYRQLLALAPGYPPAVEGLERTNAALGNEAPVEPEVLTLPPVVVPQTLPLARDGIGFRLGSGFYGVGIGISIVSFVIMLISIGRIVQIAPEITAKQAKYQSDPEAMMQLLGPQFVSLFYLSMVVLFASGIWLICDVVDRGGPYGWFVPMMILGFACLFGPYMGPGWFLIPIYLAVGRKKAPV